MNFVHILSLLGGVAFFLYGMSAMGTGLKHVAGPRLESYLWRLSSTPLKGFLLGVLVAAVIQSSSATSVMVVSFVNAGMMRFSQAICIILGANVGTTMTGWILTLSSSSGSGIFAQLFTVSVLISVLALAGIIMNMFARRNTAKNVGAILLGLAILLLAMTLISDAVSPLKGSEAFRGILILFKNPFFGVLAGMLVAAIVQSSSAGVGILQALCVTGALPYSVCLPLILGINVGASAPVLFSMIGGSRDGRRSALSYLISNVMSVFIIYILYLPAQAIFDFSWMEGAANIFGIAIMNSLIRVIAAIILLPLHKLIEKAVLLAVRPVPEENADRDEIESLNDSLLDYAPAALEQARLATVKMAEIAQKNIERAIGLFAHFDKDEFLLVQEKENLIDKYEDKLGNFTVKISKNELDSAQQGMISEVLNAIGDFERIGDHAANLSEVAEEIQEKKIVFSPSAQEELTLLTEAERRILSLAFSAFLENDPERAMRVEPLEEVIDEMCKHLRARHIERLQNSDCTILTGFVFSDLLTNLERVADHCSNIAFCVLHSRDMDSEGHEYTGSVAGSEEFRSEFERLYAEFLSPLQK